MQVTFRSTESPKMKCTQCEKEDKKSRVYQHGGSSTLMGYQNYYDEQGKLHSHNPNKYKYFYNCSEGHSFSIEYLSACSNCKYGESSASIVPDVLEKKYMIGIDRATPLEG